MVKKDMTGITKAAVHTRRVGLYPLFAPVRYLMRDTYLVNCSLVRLAYQIEKGKLRLSSSSRFEGSRISTPSGFTSFTE